tara:strand:+ start:2071 stop:2565 length:495 start_codon:yes stop_codon:yes gene_type:complete
MKNHKYLLLAVTTIIVLSLFRLIPHPPNFTPILAISVFAGIKFKDNLFSYLVPVFAMLVSDAIIGFHNGMIIIYLAIVLSAYISRRFNTINTSVLGSCILFYLITNFQVWVMSSSYPKSLNGILECYTLAIPFLGMTLLSTFFYSYVLFYGYSFLSKIQTYQKI